MRAVVRTATVALALLVATTACSSGDADTLRVYTSVTQATVDEVVAAFAEVRPGIEVEVFRAPTGELTARIAAEEREGGIQADVLWLTDPLSIQQYEAAGLLREWEPDGAAALPEDFRGDSFWGTRVLTMVVVVADGVEPPTSWADLADERFSGRVAFPDPGFAGSSFAVLGFFSEADGFGLEYYEDLAANGAVQVNAPGEVVSGVAEGRFDAGITLWFAAKNAVGNGSPISIVWPSEGGISLYSPIGVVTNASVAAEAFVEHVLSPIGQEAIASTGWQPVIGEFDVGGPQVTVDWSDLFGRQAELLSAYRAIFGG